MSGLDSPITPEEEEIVAMVRTLQAKQVELAEAEQARVAAKAKVIAERARTENLRRNFIDEMRKRGVSDPDALLRRID
jgi:hypothetical protein